MKQADKHSRVIEFLELHVQEDIYGPTLQRVYHVRDNGRSHVWESFKGLERDEQEQIRDLISRMATVPHFNSLKINYHLKGYSYGELKPKPHRFFFFQKFGANLIFFGYEHKKVNSFNDAVYKAWEEKKVLYERAFEEFLRGRGR